MSIEGRYVRVNRPSGDDFESVDYDSDYGNSPNVGKFVRAPKPSEYEESVEVEDDHQYDDYLGTIDPDSENRALRKQISDMQKVIAELSGNKENQPRHNLESNDVDGSWNSFRERCPSNTGSIPSIRWDQIKPFPKNVPANKMWEEWTKFIENFEIAASLSNAYDPVRRSQLLFLSMGEELQGIVRAAQLRPNLNEGHCYGTFIKNIENHLRSLTDTTAEHEYFSSMQQEPGESVMGFHARLMEKVRLCRYSSVDQERFVRAQLLKGMTNRELARTSRTFGHETNFIVQSATRDEAYQREVTSTRGLQLDTTINQVRERVFRTPFKRGSGDELAGGSRSKQFRVNKYATNSRRERCSRCNSGAHWNRPCPALKLKCYACGRIGHYAAACRQKRINAVHGSQCTHDVNVETKVEEVKLV